MQPIRTIWTIVVGDHLVTIYIVFGQIPISIQETMLLFELFLI